MTLLTEAELEAFTRTLSPAHETVVLLREIRDLLTAIADNTRPSGAPARLPNGKPKR